MKTVGLLRKFWKKYKKPSWFGIIFMGLGLLVSPIGIMGLFAVFLSIVMGLIMLSHPKALHRVSDKLRAEHMFFFAYLLGITFLLFQSAEYPGIITMIIIGHAPVFVSIVRGNKEQRKRLETQSKEFQEKNRIEQVVIVLESENAAITESQTVANSLKGSDESQG